MLINVRKRLIEIVLLWTLIGYPLLGIYTTVTGIDNRTVSVAVRIVVVLTSLFLIATAMSDKKFRINSLLAAFFGLYLARLVFDYAYQNNDYALVAIQFYLASVVFPAIALASYAEYILTIQKRVVILLIVSGALFIPAYFYAYRNGLFFTQGTDDTNVRYASEFVNAVSLGHFTCIVAIATFFYTIEYKPRLFERAACGAILVGTGVALFLSGSRAGFVGMVVASAVYAIARPSRLVILIPFALGGLMYLPEDNYLVRRMTDLLNSNWDTGALERMNVQSTALADFFDSPVIGKHFIDMNWGPGLYPHNILVEVLMALGLVGAVPLFLISGMSMYKALKFRSQLTFYAILYFVSFTFLQTSGALWAADSLFVLTSVLLTASKKFEPRFVAGFQRRPRPIQSSSHAPL
ncbi:O-antigen ligase family protein [Mesorhizobium sp. M0664]|uniref:O-antigen ligase family protein n=1 Tax=Mesorhizobium sp. M0664 TaxID=2956982 RepID=UPI00333CA5FB